MNTRFPWNLLADTDTQGSGAAYAEVILVRAAVLYRLLGLLQVALAIALDLAATGLPVLPCGRDKRPAISEVEGGRSHHALNLARPEPPPAHVAEATLLWAAAQLRDRAHAV